MNVYLSSSTSEGGAQPLFAWAKHNPYKECNNENHQWDHQPKEAPMVARMRWQSGGAIGGWHCLAVDEQGQAYAWGGNEYRQCGEEPERKDDTSRHLRKDIVIPKICAPKLVVRQLEHFITWLPKKMELYGHGVIMNMDNLEPKILNQDHNLFLLMGFLDLLWLILLLEAGILLSALTDDGEVYGWGRGEHGRQMARAVKWCLRDVSCGGTHSVGKGDHGRLGYGRKVTTGQPLEVPIK
ncbi:hypothetical protein CMV_014292 [Castanea mollissima]|uniref:Uncharacterized protein n=1 Tax=Castanea mollissima TaxID=60419 RepID=A0A8J4RD09_9ROSI|nr:hypothetical protein CMV_014292 [Castanea mollissima]